MPLDFGIDELACGECKIENILRYRKVREDPSLLEEPDEKVQHCEN